MMHQRPATDEDLRGTGRTLSMLRKVHELLFDGQYHMAFVVMQHRSMFRYAANLICNVLEPRALYLVSSNVLTFRDKNGMPVSIQFTTPDYEYQITRGYRLPIARDHDVLHKRTYPNSDSERRTIEELQAAGLEPHNPLYVPK